MNERRIGPRASRRSAAGLRAALILLACLAPALGGCSLFRKQPPLEPDAAAPDTTVSAPPRSADRPPAKPAAPSVPKPAEPREPEPKEEVKPPERPPSVTIRLSPDEKAARKSQFQGDVGRTESALAAVRGRSLTVKQLETLSTADRFLIDARLAFEADDLSRACAVAEKARILAEELRAQVAPP